jgi:predicted nucleic acid-binding protein
MTPRKLFFDANILLDLIDIDRGDIDITRKLVRTALLKDIILYTSCDILSNIYYVARRKLGKATLVEEMLRLLEIFEVVEIDKSMAINALETNQYDLKLDFEDLLQRSSAQRVECDMIITNDKHFVLGTIPHCSTKEALEIL